MISLFVLLCFLFVALESASQSNLTDFYAARSKWENFTSDYPSYLMRFKWTNFGSYCYGAQKFIFVANYSISNVVFGDKSLQTQCENAVFNGLDTNLYYSINDLFDFLYAALNNSAVNRVVYDDTYGYPSDVNYGIFNSYEGKSWKILCLSPYDMNASYFVSENNTNECNISEYNNILNTTSQASQGYNTYLQAREKWENFSISNYGMEFSWNCYCDYCFTARKGLLIENNNISNVYCVDKKYCDGYWKCNENDDDDSSSSEDSDENMGNLNALDNKWYRTIDGLFDYLKVAYDNNFYQIWVEYDNKYGYPKFALINQFHNLSDEAIGWNINCIYIYNQTDTCNGLFLSSNLNYKNSNLYQDLSKARSLWQSYNMSNYSMLFKYDCTCPLCYTAEKGVIVQDDNVTNAYCFDENLCDTIYNCSEWLNNDDYYTINELFDLIETAIMDGYSEIDITYHPYLGYPQIGYLDPSATIIDEELGWEILCLDVDNSTFYNYTSNPRNRRTTTPPFRMSNDSIKAFMNSKCKSFPNPQFIFLNDTVYSNRTMMDFDNDNRRNNNAQEKSFWSSIIGYFMNLTQSYNSSTQ